MALATTARPRRHISRVVQPAALRPPALRKLVARLEQALDDFMEPGTVTLVRSGRYAGTFIYRPAPGSRLPRVAALARDIARIVGLGRVDALHDVHAGVLRLRVELVPEAPRIPVSARAISDADVVSRLFQLHPAIAALDVASLLRVSVPAAVSLMREARRRVPPTRRSAFAPRYS